MDTPNPKLDSLRNLLAKASNRSKPATDTEIARFLQMFYNDSDMTFNDIGTFICDCYVDAIPGEGELMMEWNVRLCSDGINAMNKTDIKYKRDVLLMAHFGPNHERTKNIAQLNYIAVDEHGTIADPVFVGTIVTPHDGSPSGMYPFAIERIVDDVLTRSERAHLIEGGFTMTVTSPVSVEASNPGVFQLHITLLHKPTIASITSLSE